MHKTSFSLTKGTAMKYLSIALLLALGTAFAADELAPVFNGKDLTGWKVPNPNPWWEVKDGVLIGHSDDANPKLPGNVIETEKTYGDVIVETEVKWEGDIDSGIFLRKG